MSAVIIGTDYQQQAETTVHMAPDGSGEARTTVKVKTFGVYNSLPAPLTPNPTYPTLLLYEFEITNEPGDITAITGIYMGVLAPDPSILAQYEFNFTAITQPIETHPLFAYPQDDPPVTTTELAKINLALQNNVAPVGLGAPATLLYSKMVRGIDSFYAPSAQYKITSCQTDIPTDYSDVGYIVDTPPEAPTLPTGQSYLSTGISWRKAGGVVTVVQEFQGSGLAGWDLDLYTKP